MFCPSCGSSNSTVQKFCRSCGLNLERSAESLVEQLPNAHSAILLKRERKLEKFGDFAWNTFALVILISIGALIYHLATGTPIWYEGLLVAFIVCGVLAITHASLKSSLERQKTLTHAELFSDIANQRNTLDLEPPAVPFSHGALADVEADTKKLG